MVRNATKNPDLKAGRPGPGTHSPLTYNSYLKVDELKQLQVCLSDPPHHDETLFIIIHQAYELWFKLILHELDSVAKLLDEDEVRTATFYMRRVTAILRLLVEQIHILETMSPKDFLGFRYNLNPASGFQSSQFREIEFLGGLKDAKLLEHFQADPGAYEKLKQRYEQPSLQEFFYELLRRRGFDLPADEPGLTEAEPRKAEEKRIQQLLELYNNPAVHGDLLDLAECFIEFDELIFLWRTHHVTVVERMIGFKRGTGGSEGVGYLRTTLGKRCFPDLWKLRTCLEQ